MMKLTHRPRDSGRATRLYSDLYSAFSFLREREPIGHRACRSLSSDGNSADGGLSDQMESFSSPYYTLRERTDRFRMRSRFFYRRFSGTKKYEARHFAGECGGVTVHITPRSENAVLLRDWFLSRRPRRAPLHDVSFAL